MDFNRANLWMLFAIALVGLALAGCFEDKTPAKGEQPQKPKEAAEPSLDGGGAAPKEAASSTASTDPKAMAKLHRYQSLTVQFSADVPCQFTDTGRKPYSDDRSISAYFGSMPASQLETKQRLPLEWDGTKFSVKGQYDVTHEDSSSKELVDIQGQVSPDGTKILWLKTSRQEDYDVLPIMQKKSVSLSLDLGEIPLAPYPMDKGQDYLLEGKPDGALRAISYRSVTISRQQDPVVEGQFTEDRSEVKSLGKLPGYVELRVKFYEPNP